MTTSYPFIAIDCGTSRMRAMLCSGDVDGPDDVIPGPGIGQMTESPEDTVFAVVGNWLDQFGQLEILLGGMIGSNLGWRAAPYLPCPLDLDSLSQHLTRFESRGHQVAIVPGAACTNSVGQPDVMRGEEVQVAGWQSQIGDVENRLVCLPGTHTKWVHVAKRRIDSFTTAPTGELFAILKKHSVLTGKDDTQFEANSFQQGIEIARENSGSVLHTIFSTRSRGLVEPAEEYDAASYLSGLLIGTDVQTALRDADNIDAPIQLIGETALCEKFAIAIEQFGGESEILDGNMAAYAGFLAIAGGEQ